MSEMFFPQVAVWLCQRTGKTADEIAARMPDFWEIAFDLCDHAATIDNFPAQPPTETE